MSTFEEGTLMGDKTDKAVETKPDTKSKAIEKKAKDDAADDASKSDSKEEPLKVEIVSEDKLPKAIDGTDEGEGANASNTEQKMPTPDDPAPKAEDITTTGAGTVINDELTIGDITDDDTKNELDAEDYAMPVDPFAAYEGPDAAGVVRKEDGTPVFAPHGSMLAANMGLQTDASGHFESAHTNNSEKSGTRI